MHKILFLSLFAASLFANSPAQTEDPSIHKIIGGGSLGEKTYETVDCEGILKLNGSTIKKNLQVNGSLIATFANIQALDASGEVNLRSSIVSEESSIHGYLRAQSTSFKAPLTLNGRKAVFTNSKLSSITVKEEHGFKAKQVIELKQNSIVDGSIKFNSGKGEVHIYPGCKITGTVTGGKIIKKNH